MRENASRVRLYPRSEEKNKIREEIKSLRFFVIINTYAVIPAMFVVWCGLIVVCYEWAIALPVSIPVQLFLFLGIRLYIELVNDKDEQIAELKDKYELRFGAFGS